MTVEWMLSLLCIWVFPSATAHFNPFLAQIAQAIQRRNVPTVLWMAYLSGLLRDILLSSPRLGLLGISSLLTSGITYRLSHFVSVEGWQGSFIVALLAILEFFFDALFCFLGGHSDLPSFSSVWSWKSFFLFVVFSCLWACALGISAVLLRRCTTRTLRRSTT